MGFSKLWSEIVTSTIWGEPDSVRIVWITLLALSDRTGAVMASVPGLAHIARVEVEECRDALERLQRPDKDSRTETHEGRRIAPIDGGWTILNYLKYREKGRGEDRREYLRKAQAKSRAKRRQPDPVDGPPKPCRHFGRPPEERYL